MSAQDYFRQIVEFEGLSSEQRISELRNRSPNSRFTFPIIQMFSLGDKDHSIVLIAKKELMSRLSGKIKDEDMVKFTIDLLKLSKPGHKRRLVQFCGFLFGSMCVPILELAMSDPEPTVRAAAIYALEEASCPNWKDIIMEALKDSDSMVKFSALNFISLKMKNNPNFRISIKLKKLIADLIEDRDELVVLSANALLKELSLETTIV
jgi:hypothetical protein